MNNSLVQNIKTLNNLPKTWDVISYNEVVIDKSSGNKKTLKKDFLKEGNFIIVDQGKEEIAGFTNDEKLLVKSDPPYIIFGDHTRIFKYIEIPFAMGADGIKVLKSSNSSKVLEKYIFYYFLTLKIPNTGYNRHYKYLKTIKIPLPPLVEQQKIAAILDAADALRQKDQQLIDHYTTLSQSLFLDMFGDPVTNPMGWEMISLEQVCEKIQGGGTPSKKVPEYYVGEIPWVTPKDMKSKYISDSIDHINKGAIENSSAKLIGSGAVLMVIRSGVLKHTLPVAISLKEIAVNQDMKAFIPNKAITNEFYLFHFFKGVEKFLLGKVRAVTADNIV